MTTNPATAIFAKLPFSQNWNQKLWCEYFTTIRLNGNYRIGQEVTITLKGEEMYQAVIIDIKSFELRNISSWMTHLDAAMEREPFIQMMLQMYANKGATPDTTFHYYLLKRLENV